MMKLDEHKKYGIQLTLFDYFKDTESFTLNEAVECVRESKIMFKEPSVRARIYEGIDKGLFQRVSKGVYTVTRKNDKDEDITCMVINGDGRDLSYIKDNSIDAIITDHPYSLPKSHTGGNRSFANYEVFNYNDNDFKEKQRVLKPGCFLVEFLPEETGENSKYIYKVKEMAENNGFCYYATVPWKKVNFVANTGRKSKNTEQVVFFTKGKARKLKHDIKKDKAEPGVSHYMSGTNGMLPTAFEIEPVSKSEKIHESEKPLKLIKDIINFVSVEGEILLDQFAGSGVLGEAALNTNRNSILIEKDSENVEKIKKRIKSKSR